ncbi:hypothetical protein PsalMR5_04522 (plasmid) [Piscirickettsia salmonis]|nr:hypothetical protein PsalSR1_04488 [Piscirickettsia salmonis]QGP66597.1 hypothetical protein PsalMR5_04522 [Piscirickettsia salmonis]
MECADSRHVTLCDADSRGFIVVAFCSAILHHWMCKIPTEVATLTPISQAIHEGYVKDLKAIAISPTSLKYIKKVNDKEIEIPLEEIREMGESDTEFKRGVLTSPETVDSVVNQSLRV